MIICHCGIVSDRAVVDSIEDGARSLGDLCRSTGAGRRCGACIPSLQKLLCEHASVDVETPLEMDRAAS